MKLAYCFAASAMLHAGALFMIPSFSTENAEEEIVPVRIVVGDGIEINGDGKAPEAAKQVSNASHSRARGKSNQPSPEPIAARNRTTSILPAPLPVAESFSDVPPAALTEDAGSVSYASGAGSGGFANPSGTGGTGLSGTEGSGTGGGTGKATSPLKYAQAGYLNNPIPEYPERARRQGWEGTVLLNVLVSSQGKPQKIEITKSSGFEILDHAARAAVMGWRFHPARYGETPLESWVRVPIVFRLNDEKK